jgi:endonuclease YncB( thermonuclease family)
VRIALTVAELLVVTSSADAQRYRAIDGDTIGIGSEHLRIVGLDTPETVHAGCWAERSQGLRAKRRLQELLDTGPVKITRQTVTRGRNRGKPRLDKYGRILGVLRVGGRDVAKILIAEQLGVLTAGGCRRLAIRR